MTTEILDNTIPATGRRRRSGVKRMPVAITSPQNQRVKDLIKLEKRAARELRRVTLVEGVREVSRALDAGISPVEAYICPELATDPELQPALRKLEELDAARRTTLYTITPEIYAKIAVREESGGVILVIRYRSTALDHLPLRASPLFIVVENPEKPGNLGAILRTADATGADGVIVCGGTDVHNPNVIRASLGTVFTMPVAEAYTDDAIRWLRAHDLRIIAATPEGAKVYVSQEAGHERQLDAINAAVATAAVTGPATEPERRATEATPPAAEAASASAAPVSPVLPPPMAATYPNPDRRVKVYTSVDLHSPCAIVLGSEADGLTEPWLEAADDRVYIPMRGQADSLNLSASTAVILYEALRQREVEAPNKVRRNTSS